MSIFILAAMRGKSLRYARKRARVIACACLYSRLLFGWRAFLVGIGHNKIVSCRPTCGGLARQSVCVNRSHGRMAAPGAGTARSGTTPLQRLAGLAGIFGHGGAACVSDADTFLLLCMHVLTNTTGLNLPQLDFADQPAQMAVGGLLTPDISWVASQQARRMHTAAMQCT